jgi:hypothetical protein
VTFVNFWLNVFWANSAQDGGGAIVSECLGGSKCHSNTFYGNSATVSASSIKVGTGPEDDVSIRFCIIAGSSGAPAVEGPVADIDCCCLWDNDADYGVGCIVGPCNVYEDPLFCDAASGDFTIDEASPCAPDNSPDDCGLIGACPVGCATAGVDPINPESSTWGSIKAIYR